MFLELYKKDLLIFLKDLKFQIFSIVILIIFGISTYSSIASYNVSLSQYQKEEMTRNEALFNILTIKHTY